jgi:catechol 2,3-dioxygenase-like lactoylglutathione lyase family enzyme
VKYRFYYTGIRVRDLERSLGFYTEVLGLEVVGKGRMPHGGKYVHLRGKGSR